jgi:hypothetical protein
MTTHLGERTGVGRFDFTTKNMGHPETRSGPCQKKVANHVLALRSSDQNRMLRFALSRVPSWLNCEPL